MEMFWRKLCKSTQWFFCLVALVVLSDFFVLTAAVVLLYFHTASDTTEKIKSGKMTSTLSKDVVVMDCKL